MSIQKDSMMWAIATSIRLQGSDVDRLRLHSVVVDENSSLVDGLTSDGDDWKKVLLKISQDLNFKTDILNTPDAARLPALTWLPDAGWVVIRSQAISGAWVVQNMQGALLEVAASKINACARISTIVDKQGLSDKPAYELFKNVFNAHKKPLWEAAWATGLISIVALAVSLFSMQVYDRVIPTQGYQTLLVLTFGVVFALCFDWLLKIVRSHLVEESSMQMDAKLSREIFSRLLKVRMDQMPNSLGSLTAQIRGYEGVRSFLSATTLYLLIDLPFAILFMILMAVIGSPILAIIPLMLYILALLIGLASKKAIDLHTKEGMGVSNKKTGLLVEAIEGAETVKAGGGAWGMLSRWIDISDESIKHDVELRHLTEKGTYMTSFLQQLTYVLVVAIGAYLVTQGAMTMGGLIATSILSGRATAPSATLFQLLLRYATAKSSMDGLEHLYRLQSDNHNVERTIQVEKLRGAYDLESVQFSYQNAPRSLTIDKLVIKEGEKVGVIGAIGSGKSTILRLLTGMYQPLTGKILLDGIDVAHLSRQILSEQIGYLQQEHRLFNGTLRENLLIGTLDPGDEVVQAAAERTGLLHVIANHPKGLDLPISEGGKGLSGGQKQLVALTRLLISKPSIWLLDEPTASMDQQTAQLCLTALNESIQPEHTLVLVTHNPALLAFVNRLIVVANNKIVIDGARDDVLKHLAGVSRGSVSSETKGLQKEHAPQLKDEK